MFVIENFKLENGAVLPRAVVMYGTYGTLNAAKDNVVLLPSHYMADSHGYEWLIGPGKALDPATSFCVTTELFGNGKSSSPSNTPEPLHGPRFPIPSIRDNVEAVRQLLTHEFGVSHLRAIVGFSMGGQQAFQWAVSHPKFADRIVVTSATAKTWPHGLVRLESQITAIETDPVFNGGDYVDQPAKGLSAFGKVWAPWLYSQAWWREELWKTANPPGDDLRTGGGPLPRRVHPRRRRQQPDPADADLGKARRGRYARLRRRPSPRRWGAIKAPLLYMPSQTDLYFPIEDARFEAQFIPGRDLQADPLAVGPYRRRGQQSGGREVPERTTSAASWPTAPPRRRPNGDPHEVPPACRSGPGRARRGALRVRRGI